MLVFHCSSKKPSFHVGPASGALSQVTLVQISGVREVAEIQSEILGRTIHARVI